MDKSSTEILLILYLFRLYFLQIVEDIRCFCVQSSSFSVSLEIFVNKTLKVFSFLPGKKFFFDLQLLLYENSKHLNVINNSILLHLL